MFYNYLTHITRFWVVLTTQLDLAPQIYVFVSMCQLKPCFDVICDSVTARCDLFKINVSRYGSVNEH